MNRANNIRFLLLQIGRVNRRSIKELGTSVIAREHFARQFRANNTRVIITNYIQDEIHRCINFHPLYHYLIQIVKMNNVSDFFFLFLKIIIMNVSLRFIGEKEFRKWIFLLVHAMFNQCSQHSCTKASPLDHRLINRCNVLSYLKFQFDQ